MKNFAQRLKAARDRAGMNQEELGKALGVRQQSVARWESGEAFPRQSRIEAIAATLNTTAAALQFGDDATLMPRLGHDVPQDPFAASIDAYEKAAFVLAHAQRELRAADRDAMNSLLDIAEAEFVRCGYRVRHCDHGLDMIVETSDGRAFKVCPVIATTSDRAGPEVRYSCNVPRSNHDFALVAFLVGSEARFGLVPEASFRLPHGPNFIINMETGESYRPDGSERALLADWVDSFDFDYMVEHVKRVTH